MSDSGLLPKIQIFVYQNSYSWTTWILHPVPQWFRSFVLPLSITPDDALPNRIHKPEDVEDCEVHESSGDEAETPPLPPSFPQLETKIKESIQSLGGAVFQA